MMNWIYPIVFYLLLFICTSSFSMNQHATMYNNSTNDSIRLTSITNIDFIIVTNKIEIQNTYLKTGIITNYKKESLLRRFDIVYFISLPITYYFLLNLIMIKNQLFFDMPSGSITDMDWNYIYINLIFVPLYVALRDYFYMRSIELGKPITYKNTIQDVDLNDLNLRLSIYTERF